LPAVLFSSNNFRETRDTLIPPQSWLAVFQASGRYNTGKEGFMVTNPRGGACAVEGPGYCHDYTPGYYAVFFEDADGNKWEICCRTAQVR